MSVVDTSPPKSSDNTEPTLTRWPTTFSVDPGSLPPPMSTTKPRKFRRGLRFKRSGEIKECQDLWKSRLVAKLLDSVDIVAPTGPDQSSQVERRSDPNSMFYVSPTGIPATGNGDKRKGSSNLSDVKMVHGMELVLGNILGTSARVKVEIRNSQSGENKLHARSGAFAIMENYKLLGEPTGDRKLVFYLELGSQHPDSCFRFLDLPIELRHRIYRICISEHESKCDSKSEVRINKRKRISELFRRDGTLKDWGSWSEDLANQIFDQMPRAHPLLGVCSQIRLKYRKFFHEHHATSIILQSVSGSGAAHNFIWTARREYLCKNDAAFVHRFRISWAVKSHTLTYPYTPLPMNLDLLISSASGPSRAPSYTLTFDESVPEPIRESVRWKLDICMNAYFIPLLWKGKAKDLTVGDVVEAFKGLFRDCNNGWARSSLRVGPEFLIGLKLDKLSNNGRFLSGSRSNETPQA